MGQANCAGQEVDSQAFEVAWPVKQDDARVVTRELLEASSPVRESAMSSEDETDSGEEHVEMENPEADAADDASEAAESDCVRHQAIASLLLLRPEARWLSLLRAAGEEPTAEGSPAVCASGAGHGPFSGLHLPSAALLPESGVPQSVGAKTIRFKSRDIPMSPGSPSSQARWVPDATAKDCYCCEATFTFIRRRHHCRACGQVVCSSCSNGRKVMAALGHSKPARCCDSCMAKDLSRSQ